MVVATTSLLYSIEVAEMAFNESGRYGLNKSERKLLDDLNLNNVDSEEFWRKNIEQSWVQWGNRGEIE